jgi:tRNA(Arg) A34 adenosine deaminase TadA
MCAKMIHHAGIEQVFFVNTNPERWGLLEGVTYLEENNVVVVEQAYS